MEKKYKFTANVGTRIIVKLDNETEVKANPDFRAEESIAAVVEYIVSNKPTFSDFTGPSVLGSRFIVDVVCSNTLYERVRKYTTDRGFNDVRVSNKMPDNEIMIAVTYFDVEKRDLDENSDFFMRFNPTNSIAVTNELGLVQAVNDAFRSNIKFTNFVEHPRFTLQTCGCCVYEVTDHPPVGHVDKYGTFLLYGIFRCVRCGHTKKDSV